MRYAVGLAAIVVIAGCASTRYTPIIQYRLEPRIQVPTVAVAQGTLGIRTLMAARPYKQPIVFDDPGYVVTISSHSEWAEPPANVVTRALTDALVATKRFTDVGDAINMGPPDYILTGELRRFDLARTGAKWSAICEVRLELRKGLAHEPVWSVTLKAVEPLARNEVAALPAAMSRAVSKIVNQAATAIERQK